MRPLILLLAALLIFSYANAQEYGHRLYDKITAARHAGAEFPKRILFNDAGQASDSILKQYKVYQPLEAGIKGLYYEKPRSLSLALKGANGKQYTLELVRSSPASADAHITYMDANGQHSSPYETGLHYQGIVNDAEMSLAALSIFANGEVIIMFSNSEGNFNLGRIKNETGKYVLYNNKDRMIQLPFNCTVSDKDFQGNVNRSRGKTTGAIECQKVRVYWEVDSLVYAQQGNNLAATQNFVLALFNIMQGVYYNDGMAVELSAMSIWTTDDWYTKQQTLWRFGHFYGYWQSQKATYGAEQAMLLTGMAGNAYGTLEGTCGSLRYAISTIYGMINNFPAYDWDTYVVCHETGHTFGAAHSHSCNWNTGPGNTCGSIDNCTVQEPALNCQTCPSLYNVNNTGWFGTVMSYCGLRINLSAGFGSVIAAYLRNRIDTSTCLMPAISTELTTGDICNADGSITLNYPANNFGVAPYTYLWSNNATTQNITNLITSGTYYVTVTDSNGCKANDTTELRFLARPGDGQALSYKMPLCCKDTSFSVAIQASLPVSLSACQTVGWLRTAKALNSYTDVKSAYDNAQAGDIISSDNEAAINNSTSALLTVRSPTNCNSTTTYYYTPFVTRMPKKASVYTTASANPKPVKMFQKTIGTYVTIPAQSNLPAKCDLLDTPADTITINISNYTGRANHLSVRIAGADNNELYAARTLAGNGTYQIPVTATGNHLQEMYVFAYDHHCKNGDTCDAVSVAVQATRVVTYPAIPSLRFDSSCVAGKSVLLSFGPDSCNLGIEEVSSTLQHISLYPNPTQTSATLSFYANAPGTCTIALQDIAGRTLRKEALTFEQGRISKVINLNGITAGVYLIQLTEETNDVHNLKLVVR